MKKRPKEAAVPSMMSDTARHAIVSLLIGRQRSAKALSSEIGIPEKEVYDHLEHVRRSLSKTGHHLMVTPAECKKCGFLFTKRERLKKPGKCPACRGESIHEPLFTIEVDPDRPDRTNVV